MAAAMAGAAVSVMLPTAAGMTQAQKHHDKEVELQVKAEKTTQKLHMHGIINETRHFVEAFMQAEAVHAQALAQGKQQHSESMAAARRGEQREGMRDAQTNATTRVNTVWCATLYFWAVPSGWSSRGCQSRGAMQSTVHAAAAAARTSCPHGRWWTCGTGSC